MKRFTTLFALALLVFSCSKDDNSSNNSNNSNNGFNNGVTNNSNNGNNANNTTNNTNTNNANNMNNANNVTETSEQGGPCTCDAEMSTEPGHAFCQTQNDGCVGLFEYGCFFEVVSRVGVCRTQCSEAEYMTQGSCPMGTMCERFETTIHTPEMPSYFYGCN